MRAARKELGLPTAGTVMLGDTMATDVLGAVQMGYRTILTLSGSTSNDDLAQFAYSPDVVIDSIADVSNPREFLTGLVDDQREPVLSA